MRKPPILSKQTLSDIEKGRREIARGDYILLSDLKKKYSKK
jgi:hypothetical protein